MVGINKHLNAWDPFVRIFTQRFKGAHIACETGLFRDNVWKMLIKSKCLSYWWFKKLYILIKRKKCFTICAHFLQPKGPYMPPFPQLSSRVDLWFSFNAEKWCEYWRRQKTTFHLTFWLDVDTPSCINNWAYQCDSERGRNTDVQRGDGVQAPPGFPPHKKTQKTW